MKIEEMINQRRKEFGLTQKDFATLLQVGTSVVSNLESGSGNVDLQTLNQILQVLGLEFNKKEHTEDTITLRAKDLEKELEYFQKQIDDTIWNYEPHGFFAVAYYKEFITLQNKKVIVQLSDSKEDAWILYTNDKKTSFMTESKLNTLVSTKKIDFPKCVKTTSSEILKFEETLKSDDDEYTITPLGKALFSLETLTEIAKLAYALNHLDVE